MLEHADFVKRTDYAISGDEIDTEDYMTMDSSLLSSTINDEERDDIDSVPLYPGCSVTLGAFMLLLAVSTSKFNLIGDAIQQLLKIISLVLPSGHNLCTTLHEIK